MRLANEKKQRGKHTCCRSVPLPFAVFFIRILNHNGASSQKLAIHTLDRIVSCFKTVVLNKAIASGVAGIGVSHDFWGIQQSSEGGKGIVQHLLISIWVKVTNEEVGACSNTSKAPGVPKTITSHAVLPTNIKCFLVLSSFVHAHGFPIQFNHVQNFNGIISIVLRAEFNESITLHSPTVRERCKTIFDDRTYLMSIGHFVFRHMYMYHRTDLKKQFPKDFFIHLY